MKLVNIAFASITFLGLAAVGCSSSDDDASNTGDLATNESQLVTDDSDAANIDDDLESAVDEPLSGATTTNPGAPAEGKTAAEIIAIVKENAAKFFLPAGCLTSTQTGDSITHVFKECTGPYGLKTFTGTISSEYSVAGDGKITVKHAANGFTANGASISGERVVTYTQAGSVWTKTRDGQWTGKTPAGKDVSHDASFVTTYDSSTKCLTRDGSAQSTVGGRSFERTVDGYKRCGIGRFGCPESGELTLSATKSAETLTVKVTFEGGTKYSVTRPNGRVVQRRLVCSAS